MTLSTYRSAGSATSDALPPDLRSWPVRTGPDRERVGEVEEVLLDEEGVPRYLEVSLSDDGRTVLVPSGHAVLDPEEDVVWVFGLGREGFREIPSYEGGPRTVDAEYERRLGAAYEGVYSAERYYHSPHYRAAWTDAGVAPASWTPTRVETMEDVGVADHDPDPRGWAAVGRDGGRLGTVDHLLGDTASMKVRYFGLALDEELVGEARQVLIPAGHVTLEPDLERVRIDALSQARISGFPAWGGDGVERSYERKITAYLDEGYGPERRYRHPRYRARWLRRD